MSRDSGRWLDWLVTGCFSVLVGALALYGAVWLLRAIWPELLIVLGVVLAIAGIVIVWRWRMSRW